MLLQRVVHEAVLC